MFILKSNSFQSLNRQLNWQLIDIGRAILCPSIAYHCKKYFSSIDFNMDIINNIGFPNSHLCSSPKRLYSLRFCSITFRYVFFTLNVYNAKVGTKGKMVAQTSFFNYGRNFALFYLIIQVKHIGYLS